MTPQRIAAFVRMLVCIAGMTVGGVWLVAWFSGYAARWSAAGVITVKTNASLALFLAGLALLLLCPEDIRSPRRWAGVIASGLVLLIGALTLSEHLFDYDLGIDQLLAVEPPGAAATVSPNRMGPPGATSFLLLGLGLLALATKRTRPLAPYLGLATCTVSLVPAVGYLLRIDSLYGQAHLTGIAWPTVATLQALGIGLVLACSNSGPMVLLLSRDAGGALLRRFLPWAIVLPIVLGFLRVLGERAGLYDLPTGTGMLVIALVLFFTTLLWRSAAQLSRSSMAIDRAQQHLANAHVDLERLREQHHQRAEALRESEERLRRAQELAHLGTWELDIETKRLLWSNEVYRIFGLQPHEFAGTYEAFLDAVHPEDRAAVDAGYWGSLRDGKDSYEIEHRLVRKGTGEVRVVHERCEHVRDTSGRIVKSQGMVHDITERKRAEAALRAREAELEAMNAQLLEADRRKNEFLAVLSHELRNPLAPIRNCVAILERAAPGSDKARRALAVIDRQAEQLARLVDDLLDVTRITQNKIQLQRQILELNELARRTMEDQRSLFEKAHVHLELQPAPQPVFVNADWNRLAQVLGNLLQNAAKFTGQGGHTRITIRADEATQRAIIQVADTGVGMTPEMLSRLFQPFSQADSTLDRSKGGLGLGLALTKGLVELHGGDVTARSAGPGQGAEFVVQIPLAMGETPVVQPRERVAMQCRKVLIIEDNIDAAESLREVLEFGKHEVTAAYNGSEGIAKARELHPDVVLCDIGLPGMDGYEVARTLRADKALSGTYLVALSGYALPEDVQRSRDAGFDHHLAKPPSLDKLEALLARLREVPSQNRRA